MNFKYGILFFFCLVFVSCSCRKIVSDNPNITEKPIQGNIFIKDTVYIVFNKKNFKKKKYRIKPHLKLDSVLNIEFVLKKKEKDISWKYSHSKPHFKNDSIFLKPTNALSQEKVESLSMDRIISTSQLLGTENQDIYEHLRNKNIFILENIQGCNFNVYSVSFNSGFIFSGGIE